VIVAAAAVAGVIAIASGLTPAGRRRTTPRSRPTPSKITEPAPEERMKPATKTTFRNSDPTRTRGASRIPNHRCLGQDATEGHHF
jgi:hypothetical protein